MWMIREMVAALFGLSAGLLAAGGVFALISTINVIPRMAEKTKTKKSIMLYETMVLLGGTAGSVISLTEFSFNFTNAMANFVLGFYALFAGIFVGSLATALAETLNTIPIFLRRAKVIKGLGYIILAIAIGKSLGSLLQFTKGWVF